MASAAAAWTHNCTSSPERVPVRRAPFGFLTDLHDVAGAGLLQIEPTTVDGRPAVASTVVPAGARCAYSDLHVTGPIEGLPVDFLLLTLPSRLIAFNVDGMTVFVDIWARTPQDFDTWLPTAMTFVENLRFS